MEYKAFRQTGKDETGEWIRPACFCGWRGPKYYVKTFKLAVLEKTEALHVRVHNPLETKSFHCLDK